MSVSDSATNSKREQAAWMKAIKPYQNPNSLRSSWQIINSIVPYIILWYLMVLSLEVSYLLTLALAVVAAGFMMRIFIIFHDCGHGSFFKSRKANDFWGVVTGVLTFTAYYQWKHEHALHHASSGDLDRRGTGDVWTLTVEEYLKSSPKRQLGYRMFRHPFVMFILGSVYTFVISHRLFRKGATPKEKFNVHVTNLALLAIALAFSAVFGFKEYLLIQLPIVLFGGAAGIWMFYVQHNFEGVYWEHHEQWDYVEAALRGSSYYKLPKVLQWFTGNIGLHHIHHLSPRIPNYNLQACYDAVPDFQIQPLTLLSSLKCLEFRLWDEANDRLIPLRALKGMQTQTMS